jgi:ELP3 family radical SAM enzyme/protein acetyltransferase
MDSRKDYVKHLLNLMEKSMIDDINKRFEICTNQTRQKFKFQLRKGEIHGICVSNPFDTQFLSFFMDRSVRSASGILPISVSLEGKSFSCRYNCHYCPNESKANGAKYDIARSYLSSEGTFKNGIIEDFCPIKQTLRRLIQLESMGHIIDKMEFIVLGGTFHSYDPIYRNEFIHKLYYACNIFQDFSVTFNGKYSHFTREFLTQKPFLNKISIKELYEKAQLREMGTLEFEQTINESLKFSRMIGLVLETRPDQINLGTIRELRKLGCTRIQLGIQHLDRFVLDLVNRQHHADKTMKAIKHLRENGFKVDGHLMPDLPGSNEIQDRWMFNEVFCGESFQLDYCKIYPCLDVPFTEIRKWKEREDDPVVEAAIKDRNMQKLQTIAELRGKEIKDIMVWRPRSETDYSEFLRTISYGVSLVPPWVRINRVQRDFPEASEKNNQLGYVSNNIQTNEKQKVSGNEVDIRSREIRGKIPNGEPRLMIRKYTASEGIEYFISYEILNKESPDHSTLLGLLRLRLDNADLVIKAIRGTAKIRELHVYGFLESTNTTKGNAQHRGIGKKLMSIAERIAYQNGYTKISVISGVGVRNYYRSLGYSLDGTYMVKNLEGLQPLNMGDPIKWYPGNGELYLPPIERKITIDWEMIVSIVIVILLMVWLMITN